MKAILVSLLTGVLERLAEMAFEWFQKAARKREINTQVDEDVKAITEVVDGAKDNERLSEEQERKLRDAARNLASKFN